MQSSALYYSFLMLILFMVPGCGCILNSDKSLFYQGNNIANNRAKVAPYIRSVTLYDQITTSAMFDVLWLTNQVRTAYTDLYTSRRGNNQKNKQEFLLHQREETEDFISFYVLSLYKIVLDDSNSEWKLFLRIGEHTFAPVAIKAVDLPYEYQIFFGSLLTPFKTAYLATFPVEDDEEEQLITPYTRSVVLVVRSAHKDHALIWDLDKQGTVMKTKMRKMEKTEEVL